MLLAGGLTITVTSRETFRHVTLRMRCARRRPESEAGKRWPTVPWSDATHVFIDSFDGTKVALYKRYPGVLEFERTASEAARWTVGAVFRYAAGDYPGLLDVAELTGVGFCRRCGRELTDPESVDRGYGPECMGLATASRSAILTA